jgi:hypothetical protein
LYGPGLLLQQFVEFAEQSGAAYITTDLALKWATEPADSRQTWWAMRLGVVRRFAEYCRTTIAMACHIAAFENAPQPGDRCLIQMFPNHSFCRAPPWQGSDGLDPPPSDRLRGRRRVFP